MDDQRWDEVRKELEAIKQRNARVEADKAWEVSYFRIVAICIITYVVACGLLCIIGTKEWWLGACIPTAGFFLSAQSLPALKRWWIRARYRQE